MRPRWFGRARHSGVRKKSADVIIGLLYRGDWPAMVNRALGLQGTLARTDHEFRIRRASADKPAMRVVFVSDFHAGPTVHGSLLADVFRMIEDARPDLLLLGGDFVSFHANYVNRLIEPLRRIDAPLGKFAVLGNHDLLGDDAYITHRLADAGVRVLVNENVPLPAPHDDVCIVGLDDWDEGAPDAAPAFRGATGTRLLLAHGPDALLDTGDHAFDVAFFGHVHGGQFLLRDGRPLIGHRGEMSQRYLLGGVHPGGPTNAPMVISRGIGTSTLPARRFADPEVHVCTLVARDS
jgi:predicted MPP superfamily phosphohydrolase